MTRKAQAAIRARVLAKPEAVVVCLRIKAARLGLGEPHSDENHARRLEEALAWWEGEVQAAIARINALPEEPKITEAEFAVLLIDRLRADPEYGWDRILRGKAN